MKIFIEITIHKGIFTKAIDTMFELIEVEDVAVTLVNIATL